MTTGERDFFAVYEAELIPAIFAPWPAELLALVDAEPGQRVLDVGCGTGTVARAAARRVGSRGRVVGCDLRLGMVATATGGVGGGGGGGAPLAWAVADAAALPFADDGFDVVVCQQALQHVGDKSAAMAEMVRVTSPGGRVGVAAWAAIAASPGFAALRAELDERIGPAAGRVAAGPFAIPDGDALADLARGAGLLDVEVVARTHPTAFRSAAHFTGVFVSRPFMPVWDDHDPATWAEVRAQVGARLAPYDGPGGLRFPMTSHLLFGRAPA